MISTLRTAGVRMEMALTGQLPASIHKNMRVELWVGMAYGAFYAMTIPFIPVLLRRTGATPEMLAKRPCPTKRRRSYATAGRCAFAGPACE